jgi:hypothetical protein
MAISTIEELNDLITAVEEGRLPKTELVAVFKGVRDLLEQNNTESLNLEWDSAVTYDTPATAESSGNPSYSEYGERLWKSKVDANINNLPPSDSAITSNAYWEEVSKAAGSPFKEWTAGLYGAGLIVVLHNDSLYKLAVATRPYESLDINAEITAGDWLPVSVLDEDTFVSNSSTKAPSQQSAKAFIEAITGLLLNLSTTDKTNLVAAINELVTTKEDAANKGAASGYAPLDSASKVPALYLPSYVDDIIEAATLSDFPATGEASKVYIALDTNKSYRWSGSAYVEVSPSDVNSVAGHTGIVTIAQILTQLLTVDGAGSGLDADLLGGIASSEYIRKISSGNPDVDTISGTGIYNVSTSINTPTGNNGLFLDFTGSTTNNRKELNFWLKDEVNAPLYVRVSGFDVGGNHKGDWKKVITDSDDNTLKGKLTLASITKPMRLNNVTTANRDDYATPAYGDFLFNSTTNKIDYHNGGNWKQLLDTDDLATVADNNVITKTAAFTLTATNKGKTIECSGTFTITIPAGLAAEWNCTIVNIGTGIITLAVATGVTLGSKGTKLAEQWGALTLYNNVVDSFRAIGDLT